MFQRKPSRAFLVIVVWLAWISEFVVSMYRDSLKEREEYSDFTFGFPIPYYTQTWRPGYEQMYPTTDFSLTYLMTNICIVLATSIVIARIFGASK